VDKPRRTTRVFWLVFFGLMFVFAGSVVWYTRGVLKPYPGDAKAVQALVSTTQVQVQKTPYGWDFIPVSTNKPTAGFIFYPGGLVRPEAYAPLMQRIAKAGYLVALLEVRFNLAVTEQGKARQPIAAHPGLAWSVGGHSLGGVVAANFADSNPQIKSTVLWAGYPQNDFSAKTLPTLALFAELDGVLTEKQRQENLKKMPKNTQISILPGLSHSSFGSYGLQKGDNPPTQSPEAGWQSITSNTLSFLNKHNKP
jgi:hypothetical protein